jgi:hypothetical protein
MLSILIDFDVAAISFQGAYFIFAVNLTLSGRFFWGQLN